MVRVEWPMVYTGPLSFCVSVIDLTVDASVRSESLGSTARVADRT
jgi:hypothetical protein